MIEVYTDASMKTINNRYFGCAGAICPSTNDSNYIILPDCTNNQAELIAIYLGIELLAKYDDNNKFLYSDSKISVFSIRNWIHEWMKTSVNDILYGSNNKPVKNQSIMIMIVNYVIQHNMIVNLRHQKGHVNFKDPRSLYEANEVFASSNGYYLSPEKIYEISYFNDMVDKQSRTKLDGIDSKLFKCINSIDRKPLIRDILPESKLFKNRIV